MRDTAPGPLGLRSARRPLSRRGPLPRASLWVAGRSLPPSVSTQSRVLGRRRDWPLLWQPGLCLHRDHADRVGWTWCLHRVPGRPSTALQEGGDARAQTSALCLGEGEEVAGHQLPPHPLRGREEPPAGVLRGRRRDGNAPPLPAHPSAPPLPGRCSLPAACPPPLGHPGLGADEEAGPPGGQRRKCRSLS